MAAAERSEDNSISMRVALFGIRKAFPRVKQLETAELEKFMRANKHKNLILLDVREKDEFDVSHLRKAVHIKPDEPVDQVMITIKEQLKNIYDQHVKIVCYCSLGYRSSNMAQKLYSDFKIMKEKEEIDVTSELWNLEGSIFKWANEERELVDCNNEKTQYCHPYNYLYGKLLDARFRVYEPSSKLD